MTNFLQVKDNAKTLAPFGSLNNTTSPLTINGINTSSFLTVTTGYVLTIWDDVNYADPGDDPLMEKVTVTACTVAHNGSITITRPNPSAHLATPRIALLAISQHLIDLAGAVNTLESQITTKANSSSLSTVATSGSYADLSNKPTIPAAQINTDWNASTGIAQIINKPTLSTVATSGAYTDLTGRPTIPTQYTDALAAAAAPIQSVAGRTGVISLTKSDVLLGNVDNTSDLSKPISTATQVALNVKVAKGEIIINVKDYGAKGDGTTDDTAAFNAAVAALPVGGELFAPYGVYIINGTITLAPSLTLRGAGMDNGNTIVGTTLKRGTASATPMIKLVGGTPPGSAVSTTALKRGLITSLTLRGNGLSDDLVQAFYTNRCDFDRVRFIGTTGHAIYGVEFWDTVIMRCQFDVTGSQTNASVLLQNRASATIGTYGYSADNINRITFRDDTWESFTSKCIELDGTSNGSTNLVNNITIDNCKMETTTFQNPFISVTTQVRSIYISKTYLAADSQTDGTYSGGAKDMVLYTGSGLSINDITAYQGTTGIVNSVIHLTGHAGANKISKIDCNFSGFAPVSGAAILIDAPITPSRDSVDNIKVDVGKRGIDNGGYAGFRMEHRAIIEADQQPTLRWDQTGPNAKTVDWGLTASGNMSIQPNNNLLITFKNASSTNFAALNTTTGMTGFGLDATTVSPTASLYAGGSYGSVVTTKTASFTYSATDNTILADATSGALTATLPDATACKGREYTIIKIDASANAVILATTSSQTINGSTTYSSTIQYGNVRVKSDGANWVAFLSAGGTVVDATSTVKGVIQLTGDLGGTAASPTVPALANKQPINTKLTNFSALAADGLVGYRTSDGAVFGRTITGTTNNIVVTNGSGATGNPTLDIGTNVATKTYVDTADATKEPTVTAGTTAQYYRGDKTFQTLNQDAVPSGTTNKAYTATEQTKLAGVATGATANSTDATLLNRANHTGTQTASTISDFSTAADARITAAAGVTLATLSGGKIPSSQIPAIALVSVQPAASQAAQLALTTQEGDVVVRTDTNVTYMRNSGVTGTMTDFTLLNTPTAPVTSVNSQTGAVVLGKTDVGLGNVDNTSDATKNSATAVFSNKDLTSGTNTFPTFNQNTTGSAAKLTTGRTIAATGDITYTSPAFDGSANVTAAATVTRVNGVSLASLATGILKNTTTTGVPSIAVAADFPTLNQNTTGTASTITGSITESQVTNLATDLATKQATLVSGTNIKTINGTTLLGSGDVTIAGASDATTLAKGIVQLTGDLGGTAASPTVPALASKAASGANTDITSLTSTQLITPKIVSGDGIYDTNGNRVIKFFSGSTSVNYIIQQNSATGAAPAIYPDGTDTNIHLDFFAKGTGAVRVNSSRVVTETEAQTVTNKVIDGTANTVQNIPESAVTNLTTDLAAKASLSGTNAFTGTNSFVDANFSISDDTTPTKIAKFEIAGLASGTTTFALPAIATTLVGRSSTDTLTNKTLGAWTQTDATNITFGTTTGTQIGTSTTQKLGFFGTTPVVQQTAAQDLGTTLSTLGLRAAGGTYTITTSGAVTLTGAFKQGPATRTANITITSTMIEHNLCDATTASFVVTLPTTASNNGQRLTFKKIDSSANTITLTPQASQLIDGATNLVISVQNKYVTIISNGTNWYIIANN